MFAPIGLAAAADSAPDTNDIPPLRPPLEAIPPGTWELYGTWIILGSIAALLVLALVVRWLLRPRPVIPLPPELCARQTLEPLRGPARDPVVLVKISRAVRAYFTGAFHLPPDEQTTTEFARILQGTPDIGPDLATTATGFLRRLDEKKFAPEDRHADWDPATEGLQLVEAAESRRAALTPRTSAKKA
jgi:hypothetical protein